MKYTPKDNNPASRLYRAVHAARAAYKPNHTFYAVWQEALGLQDHAPDIFRGVAQVQDLLEETVAAVEALASAVPPVNVELHLVWRENLLRLLKQRNLAEGASGIQTWVDDLTLTTLAHTAEKLGEAAAEPQVEPDILKQLQMRLTDVEASIRSDVSNAELKRALLYGVNWMRSALGTYGIGGARELKKAMSYSLGCLAMNLPATQAEKDSGTWFGALTGLLREILTNITTISLQLPVGAATIALEACLASVR